MESLMWKDGRRRCGGSVDVRLAGDDEVLDDEVDGEGVDGVAAALAGDACVCKATACAW